MGILINKKIHLCSYLQFWDIEDSDVISYGSHNNSGQVFTAWKLHLSDLQGKETVTSHVTHNDNESKVC